MSEEQYYCVPCKNGTDFYEESIKVEKWFVDPITGEATDLDQNGCYYRDDDCAIYCNECNEVMHEMMIPPPEELDENAFAEYYDSNVITSDLICSASDWRKANPIAFNLARQEYNAMLRHQWEQEQEKEKANV